MLVVKWRERSVMTVLEGTANKDFLRIASEFLCVTAQYEINAYAKRNGAYVVDISGNCMCNIMPSTVREEYFVIIN